MSDSLYTYNGGKNRVMFLLCVSVCRGTVLYTRYMDGCFFYYIYCSTGDKLRAPSFSSSFFPFMCAKQRMKKICNVGENMYSMSPFGYVCGDVCAEETKITAHRVKYIEQTSVYRVGICSECIEQNNNLNCIIFVQ